MRAERSPNAEGRAAATRRCTFAALIAAILVGLLGTGLLTPATATAQDETYTVATDTTFAPFEFQDEQGNFVGIDMDLLRAIAKDQGFTVDIKPLGFDAALQAVQANQVDGVIAGMSITDKRKQVFDFSDPYFESGVQMAVLKTNDDIKSYEDLKGKRVAVKNGTEGATFAEFDQGQVRLQTVSFADSSTMFDEVKTGTPLRSSRTTPCSLYGITQGNGFKTVTPKEKPAELRVRGQQGPERRTADEVQRPGLKNLQGSRAEYDEIVDAYLGEGATHRRQLVLRPDRRAPSRSCCKGLKMTDHPDGRLDRYRTGARRRSSDCSGYRARFGCAPSAPPSSTSSAALRCWCRRSSSTSASRPRSASRCRR